MEKQLRIGIIGTSNYVESSHYHLFHADPRVQIAAICGRRREPAEDLARKYAVPAIYSDYRKMIESAGLDAIVIGAPDDLHYPMTMTALEAGLHVLCEKPIAMNARDAKAMLDRAEEKNLRHMTYFTWRMMPLYQYIYDMIQQGAIGKLIVSQFNFQFSFGLNSKYTWRADGAHSNGVAGDLGAHMFDLARFFCGDISRVCGHLGFNVQHESPEGQPFEAANDSAIAMLEFINGGHATVHVSTIVRHDNSFLRIALHGTSGSILTGMQLDGADTIRMAKEGEQFQTIEIPDAYMDGVDRTKSFISQHNDIYKHQRLGGSQFVDAILENRSAIPSFYDGWKAQQVIDAVLASHESGTWVRI
jgi:predicted dehydrogenase